MPRAVDRFRPSLVYLEDRQLLSVDVLTYHNDNARTGLDPNETILTPANVKANTFGKLFVDGVDGQVYAQPLIKTGAAIPGQGTHNVLYVATEHDSVYAFDADTGAPLWHVSLLGAGEVPSDNRGSDLVGPEVGITATPVIDPSTGTMYVEAMSKLVSGDTTTYFQRLHALDITTGADKVDPKSIDSSISVPGAGPGGDGTHVFFDPKQQLERDALLLVNGVVYTSWASHNDQAPFTGWIIGFRANDLSLASVLNTDPNGAPANMDLPDGSGGSFWNSGSGPAADASGNIYNISGNGPFDTNLNANGFPTNGDYGDSYLKFSTAGGLAVADYFTPSYQLDLAEHDLDLGSSGILLVDIPDGSGTIRHLAIGSGKDGHIYVVDRDNMGKFNSDNNNNIYQLTDSSALGGSEFGAPAYFDGRVYFGAVGATLQFYQFSGGKLPSSPTSQTPSTFGYPGTTPSISSNGTSNGIVWAAENGDTAVLHAYDANDLSRELYNSNQAANGRDQFGAGIKFFTPTVANGKVYVGTTNGVAVLGLLGTSSNQPPTVVTPASASPNPVSGTTTSLSVLGADPQDPESALSYTWAATTVAPGAPAPTFSVNGTNAAKGTTATFAAAGNYTFQVTITDSAGLTATSLVNVTVNQTPTSIAVVPPAATVPDGGTQQFVAVARDQFGATLATQPSLTWSLAPAGLGAIGPTGLYTAPGTGTGTATVRAASGAVVGSATVTVTAIRLAPTFVAHIHFSNTTTQVPAGYINDIGLPYGPRGNGLTFGWNVNNTKHARDRDNPASPDERYDSFNRMQAPSRPRAASWQIAVPNGTYTVHLSAGDPNLTNSIYKIQVNGVLAINRRPTRSKHWVENTVTVTVTNGILEVSNAPGARNNKIDDIDITLNSIAQKSQGPHPVGPQIQGRGLNRRHGR
jgi:hypothetical protein